MTSGNRNRTATNGILLLLVLVAVFCGRIAWGNARSLHRYDSLVAYRDAGMMTAADYDAMAQAEAGAEASARFALWTQLDNRRAMDPASGRQLSIAVLAVRGDSRLVLPCAQVVAMDDLEGCLLDRASAMYLFGGDCVQDGTVIGAILECEGARYSVRGIVDMPAPTLLLQLPRHSELTLPHISTEGAGESAFLLRHDLHPALILPYSGFSRLAEALGDLPMATLAILVCGILARKRRRWREYPVRSAALFAALCACATPLLLGMLAAVPAGYLPSRWSDFSAWSAALAQCKSDALALFAAAKLRPELLLLHGVGGAAPAILSAAAIALLSVVRRGLNRRDETG